MQTEQEVEEEKKAIARDAQLEADKSLPARASDRYWDFQSKNRWQLAGVAFAVFLGAAAYLIKACQ